MGNPLAVPMEYVGEQLDPYNGSVDPDLYNNQDHGCPRCRGFGRRLNNEEEWAVTAVQSNLGGFTYEVGEDLGDE